MEGPSSRPSRGVKTIESLGKKIDRLDQARSNQNEKGEEPGINRRLQSILIISLAIIIVLILTPNSILETILINLIKEKILVGLLLFFGLLTISLLWSAGQRLDTWIFLYFNQHSLRSGLLDGLMWLTTQIGNGAFALGLAGIFFLKNDRRLAFTLALGVLTLWLTVELVKAITGRARPFLTISDTNVVGWREIGRSFPSGHTSQSFFLASLLVQHFQLGFWAGLACYILASLVGFSRVYIGVHYPRDVVAGALLGGVWGITSVLLIG
jgi:membrane-associated phospholipid phosphatase